jgi:hypothetical protein
MIKNGGVPPNTARLTNGRSFEFETSLPGSCLIPGKSQQSSQIKQVHRTEVFYRTIRGRLSIAL